MVSADIQNPKKTNVQIIFQEQETDVTLRAIESILAQTGSGPITMSVLLNGGVRPDLREKLSQFPTIRYYEADSNLGVAGGRNVLLRTEEARESDYIVFIDNDAIVTCDYVAKITRFLQDHPEAGVVGAVSLKYPIFKKHLDEIGIAFTGYLGCDIWGVGNAQVARFLELHPEPRFIDHIGTNKDWRGAYLSDRGNLDSILSYLDKDYKRSFFVTNAADRTITADVLRGKTDCIEVSNIPGCTQAFRSSLLDEIGYLNDMFNYYGFEDADFAVRAIRYGYTNYIDCGCYMFHGTDTRHASRTTSSGTQWKQSNEGRVRTIFEYLHAPEDFPMLGMRRIAGRSMMSGYWSDMAGHEFNRSEEVYFSAVGFQQAVAQLRAEYGEEFDQVVAAGCAKHNIDLGGLPLSAIPLPAMPQHSSDQRPASLLYDQAISGAREAGWNEGLATPAVQSFANNPVDFKALRQFKDIHKGERCFIIGNGPSLNKTDFLMLKDEITFGVNGIFYMNDSIGFSPTYYTVEDNHVMADNLERIRGLRARARFFPEKYREVLGDVDDIFYLPVDWSFYFKSSKYFESPQFSDDLSQQVFVGQTVTYMNMQLAHYMGFSEVYLIGLDFSYEIPKADPIEGFTITSQEDDPNHFHPDYFGKGKKWHFPKLHNCLKSYLHAGEHYKANGRTIYNATYGGRLECYERVDFGTLFDDFVPLRKPNDKFIRRSNEFLQEYAAADQTPGTVVYGLTDDREADVQTLCSTHLKGQCAVLMPDSTLPEQQSDTVIFTDSDAFVQDESQTEIQDQATKVSAGIFADLFQAGAIVLGSTTFAATSPVGQALWQALPDIVANRAGGPVWCHNDLLIAPGAQQAFMGKLTPATMHPGRIDQSDPVHLAAHTEIIRDDRVIFVPLHLDQTGAWSELYRTLLVALSEAHIPFLLTANGVYA